MSLIGHFTWADMLDSPPTPTPSHLFSGNLFSWESLGSVQHLVFSDILLVLSNFPAGSMRHREVE